MLALLKEDREVFAHILGVHFGDRDDDERHQGLFRFDEDLGEGADVCLVSLDVERLERLIRIEDPVDLHTLLVESEADELRLVVMSVDSKRDGAHDDEKCEYVIAKDDGSTGNSDADDAERPIPISALRLVNVLVRLPRYRRFHTVKYIP